MATVLLILRRSIPPAHYQTILGLWSVLMALGSFAAEPLGAQTNDSCCNVIELRQYSLYPGRRESFIQLFDSTFADPLDATGMTVIGQFRDLDRPDRFVWMRGFPDMESRAKELGAFYGSDLWHAKRDEANSSIDDSDNVLLLEFLSPALKFKDIPPRPAATKEVTRSGLVVVTLYYTNADHPAEFGALFDRSLRTHTEAAGARTLAEYITSTEANNYPKLPIRIGEHIFVWVTQFASPDAYTTYQAKLAADHKWTRSLWPEARARLSRDPEVLRLTPTLRSRLRG
jgi:hypothetical protein